MVGGDAAIDLLPLRRNPLDRLVARRVLGEAGELQSACEHRVTNPAPPDGPAELEHQRAVLELLDAPPELELALAQARIVRLPQVTGDVGVGYAHGGAAGEQRAVLER